MSRSRLTNPRLLARTLAVTLLLGTAACQPRRSAPAPTRTVPLVFSNESMEKADVWVGTLGKKSHRVGAVLGGETSTLRVPKHYYENGRFNISTVLRGSPRTPWVELQDVRPEEELRVRLPKNGTRLELIR